MTITVFDGSKRTELPFMEGDTILEALQRGGMTGVHAPCGGKGVCKKCTVSVRSKSVCGPCLSCLTKAEDGMAVELSPVVRMSFAEDSSADLYPPTSGQSGYAVACDLGTTTLVCTLLRLDTGEKIAAVSGSNAQSVYGGNVLSRLQAASEGKAQELTDILRQQVNGYLAALCREADISMSDIHLLSAAGNTIMEHFFAGLNPAENGIAPFRPLSLFGELLDARELGLCFDGSVYLCPAVSGLLGGDVMAGLLASGLGKAERPSLLADLGSNTELILGCKDRFVACTADAGAAFKASLLDHGMTASAGAIDGVEYENGELKLHVLGGGKALGVCGSGYIDALGVMYRLGALDEIGHIADPEDAPEAAPFLGELEGEAVFFLTPDHRVCITQPDISKFQLAKAAVSAGIQILAEETGIGVEDIDAVCLAGGFGSFVRPDSAAAIGLIPAELLEKAKLMGNLSAAGAISAALSEQARADLRRLRDTVRFIDLPTHPSFNDAYVEGMMFE